MFRINRGIFKHFDFILIALIIPIISLSGYLIAEISPELSEKHLYYLLIGSITFFIVFFIPIRKFIWLAPIFYWFNILLLFCVEFFGATKLGAKRWIEVPFTNFTFQPSELIKPSFILMLAYIIQKKPPSKDGYSLKEFLKISFYILLPFILILKEPDLGTALSLLIIGFAILFVIGVHWKIWVYIIILVSIFLPFFYTNLHDYQKKRIKDFLSEKPSYHVQQSIIAIGSGGLFGKNKEEATQTQMKFLPISSSDFIFAYLVERFGFFGAFLLILMYAMLILHIFSFNYLEEDYYIRVVSLGLSFMLFIYMSVNIAMTVGLAPVVGIPLPIFSYGGSSFLNFMVIFAILENLLAFRFNFMYNMGRRYGVS